MQSLNQKCWCNIHGCDILCILHTIRVETKTTQIAPISGAIDQDIHAFPTNSNMVRLLGQQQQDKIQTRHQPSKTFRWQDSSDRSGGTQLFIKNSVLEATKIYGWHFLIFRLTININQDHLFLFCQCIKVNNSTKLETHLKLHYTILAASINQIQKLF